MTAVFEACYGTRPGAIQMTTNLTEAQQVADQFFNTEPKETHEMEPCKEGEHDKVFSGLYQACNPPNWWWICKTCGELGRDNAHVVRARDVREFSRLMVKFHPADAGWWKTFLK